MKLNKQLSLLLCGALMASALAGCGGGQDASSASGSASASQSGSASSGASSSDSYVLPNLKMCIRDSSPSDSLFILIPPLPMTFPSGLLP